jgi:hypothetical protein
MRILNPFSIKTIINEFILILLLFINPTVFLKIERNYFFTILAFLNLNLNLTPMNLLL